MPCIHDVSLLTDCERCDTYVSEPVYDRWTHLLTLIAQYGGERFAAGWRAHANGPLIKVDSRVGVEDNDLMAMIVAEMLKLQREMGED